MSKTLKKAVGICNLDYSHILEFGVYKGKTIKFLRDSFIDRYQVFGFDSFIGLPEDWVGTSHKKGDMSAGGNIPNIPGVKFYKGWFTETIPEYLKIADDICILHIDCDLYSSTVEVLQSLNDYIKAGTILVFDEFYYNHNPKYNDHEQKAFYEWVDAFDRKFEMVDRIEDERQIIKIVG